MTTKLTTAQPRLLTQELIAIDKIVDDGKNPRLESKLDRDLIDELADSIALRGLLEPIGVCPNDKAGSFHLVYGARRLMAAKKVGWKKIPALIDQRSDLEREGDRAAENIKRRNLNPAEEVVLAMQMVEVCGGDVERAADEL